MRWSNLDPLFQTTLQDLAESSDKSKFMQYTSALGFTKVETELIYDAIRLKYFKKHQKFQQQQINRSRQSKSLTSSPIRRPAPIIRGMPGSFILINPAKPQKYINVSMCKNTTSEASLTTKTSKKDDTE